MDKTKTVAWMCVAIVVLLIVVIIVQLTTKQSLVTADGKSAVINSTNLLKKS